MTPIRVTALVLLMAPSAQAEIFDDSDKLKGQYIVDVGTLEHLRCPMYGKYDCSTWPGELYKFGDRCVQIVGYYNAYSSSKAILTIDGSKKQSIFVLPGGIGSDDTKQYSITPYNCPSMY